MLIDFKFNQLNVFQIDKKNTFKPFSHHRCGSIHWSSNVIAPVLEKDE